MFKTFTMQLRITPKLSPELEREIDRLEKLVESPELLVRLLRQAAAETLLASYRKRFLAGFSDALNMQRASSPGGTRKSTKIDKAMEALNSAAESLAEAQVDGTSTAGLDRRIKKAESQLSDAFDRNPQGPLSTGNFRPLALRVLRLLSDVAEMGERTNTTNIQLGIGNILALDAIDTPSATPLLTGHDTASPMRTLWKHLEFGTGVYATGVGKTANANSPHRSRNAGGWWFGPRPGFGLHLLGSKGTHALFDEATGLPYQEDAMKFEDTFGAHFTRALRG
jgi:hypothetical protein